MAMMAITTNSSISVKPRMACLNIKIDPTFPAGTEYIESRIIQADNIKLLPRPFNRNHGRGDLRQDCMA